MYVTLYRKKAEIRRSPATSECLFLIRRELTELSGWRTTQEVLLIAVLIYNRDLESFL